MEIIMKRYWKHMLAIPLLVIPALASTAFSDGERQKLTKIDKQINRQAQQMLADGRQIFRYDTFGDEAFWGDTLKLHQAIKGAPLGGVGPGVSPKTALAVASRLMWMRFRLISYPA
jgi:hypothetical protein